MLPVRDTTKSFCHEECAKPSGNTHPVQHQQILDDNLCDDVLHLGGKGCGTELRQVTKGDYGRQVIGRIGVQRLLNVLHTQNENDKSSHREQIMLKSIFFPPFDLFLKKQQQIISL
jgi:hypothetical protein